MRRLSSTYSARITPEPALRLVVFVVSGGLGAAGAWVVLGLPWPIAARLVAVSLWLGWVSAGIGRQWRGFATAGRYVIRPGGDVDVIAPGGRRRPAQLVDGTTVFSRIAWLRVRTADGRGWGELIRHPGAADKRLKNKEWRRLLVICRHPGAC